ncbi:MAG: class I SAM-dependent rRNA methyltransferase [Chloroflexota bacterium]|nr:class I SAM-dependent rRNA methyltransferase [Chloroflexota bacterium]
MTTVTLKPKRLKPVQNRHPWVFSGAIDRIDPTAEDGQVADVVDNGGNWLARGYVNRRSQIQLRLLTWQRDEVVDEAFWRYRLERAIEQRAALAADPTTNAYRLVHAESDGLPGLIVDRYDDWLVIQILTLGMERIKPTIIRLLEELCQPQAIVERSDVDVRKKEGLPMFAGIVSGDMAPDEDPNRAALTIQENGYRFHVDILGGQKTGFYLDQRENRRRIAPYCAGARMVNAFAYSGGFAVYGLGGGARHVINVDSSLEALELGERNLALNGFDPDAQAEGILGNVFDVLRDWRASREQFDAIILDPPKFAHNRRQVDRAARAYKDVNLLAMQLLRPGGVLVTFSCSGLVSADLFQKIIFGASVDANRDAQIVERLSQGSDHPVLLSFPEGEYLKGLICRVW